MAGTFDSTVQTLSGALTGGIVPANSTDLISAANFTLPYDIEIVGLTAGHRTTTAASNVWTSVYVATTNQGVLTVNASQVLTNARSLYGTPSGAASIAYAKVDQGILTLAGTPATSVAIGPTGGVAAGSATFTTASDVSSNLVVGMYVVGSGIVPGTRLQSVSTTTIGLDQANGAIPAGATLAFYRCPTTLVTANGTANSAANTGANFAGASVTVAGITDTFWNNFNTSSNGNVPWKLIDVTADTSFVKYRIGPIPQNELYVPTTTTFAPAGFWAFTTNDLANANTAGVQYFSTLSQSGSPTMSITNACVANASAATTSVISNVAGAPDSYALAGALNNGVGVAALTYSVPVNFGTYGGGFRVRANTPFAVAARTVNACGIPAGAGANTAQNNYYFNLAIRKF